MEGQAQPEMKQGSLSDEAEAGVHVEARGQLFGVGFLPLSWEWDAGYNACMSQSGRPKAGFHLGQQGQSCEVARTHALPGHREGFSCTLCPSH